VNGCLNERGLEECGIDSSEPMDLRLPLPEFLQKYRKEQGPCVVVGAVTFGEIRNGVGRVLEHSRGVGHALQVVEPPIGEFGLLLGQGPDRQRLDRLVLPAEACPLE